MLAIDGGFILRVAPRFRGEKRSEQLRIVEAISSDFASTLYSYKIDSILRIAHFMGQVTHECAGFRTTEEFASGEAYEGRTDLGNTENGDGRRFKGRGLIQLTGRYNYKKMSTKLGVDLIKDPELAAKPLLSLKIACEYWQSRDINVPADVDDLIAVTRAVNGGLNGLQDRKTYYRKAKTELAMLAGNIIADNEPFEKEVLRRGATGQLVGELQRALRAYGYHLTVDDEFGAATELAVVLFQSQHGLTSDGIVGKKTWAALG